MSKGILLVSLRQLEVLPGLEKNLHVKTKTQMSLDQAFEFLTARIKDHASTRVIRDKLSFNY